MVKPEREARSMLIVDDDDTLRSRLVRAFEARGFKVTGAASPQQALLVANEKSPDMAVIDLRMPGGSGLELVRDLHELDSKIQIVVLTGHGSIATAIESMRLGAIYYLPKPADADEILAAFARGTAPPLATIPPISETPSLAQAEYEYINRVLTDCGGNVSEAARRLRMHRRSLQRKISKRPSD